MFYKLFLFLLFCSFESFSQSNKADWFSKAQNAIFVHCPNGAQNSGSAWSRGKKTFGDDGVNIFDVQKLASEVKATGVGYVIFSLQQSDEFFCAPNTTFKKLTGFKRGSFTGDRDLIAGLYTALKAKNIEFRIL